MADTTPIKPLPNDSPLRLRYAELMKEAKRVVVPRLKPGDADSLIIQIAELLSVPVPAIGMPSAHVKAWHSCLVDQGLGELFIHAGKQLLTVFILLCWRSIHRQHATEAHERLEASTEGRTVKQHRLITNDMGGVPDTDDPDAAYTMENNDGSND